MSITGHESAFGAACEATQIPDAVLAAADASGKFRYIKAFGKTARGEELSMDSVMLMGGCTNLMTTVAVCLSQYQRIKVDSEPDRSYIDLISGALTFQPGASWTYSPGLGWAGKLVERVSNLPLEAYMRTNIWDPLGMRHCANDGRVLEPSLVDEMLRPQLGSKGKASLNQAAQNVDSFRLTFGQAFDMDTQSLDGGLGGEIGLMNEIGFQRAGTMAWFGLPNTLAWIDKESGLCGVYFSQLLPMGDAKVKELAKLFQQAVYQTYGEFRAT
ncbi:putative Beta-lactamase-related domain-containing protein [Seiridium cardinale]|uniref:Beta-lactamase-related domain-containing protein n=1 Tax=Seiridium cardinale TaxID=138064 RepID=A0ABR2XR44_9PEZI